VKPLRGCSDKSALVSPFVFAVLVAIIKQVRGGAQNHSITRWSRANLNLAPTDTSGQNFVRPRVAASTYLNTAPLIWSFSRGSRRGEVELIDAVPARCANLLADDEVDVALVPVIEYQRIPDISVVPEVCVGSRRRVRSVVLAVKVESLKDVRRVALDESSRTSAALVRIIFREFLGFEPDWISSAPNVDQMLKESDAALIIGDPGMTFARENLRVFDLAALWREYTGLGFVFAMWMMRDSAGPDARRIDFAAARDEGLARSEEIVEYYEPLLCLSREELRIYLHENISFSIDEEMRAGLDLYFKLAHKHGIITRLKSLKMAAP
jgi:chorismate dehydratase